MSDTSRPAFTLVEIIISMAIFAVLTVIVFWNIASEKDRGVLKASVERIMTDLQGAQANAQAGVMFANGAPPFGYGLHFDAAQTDSFITFADGVKQSALPPVTYTTSANHLYDGGNEQAAQRSLLRDTEIVQVKAGNIPLEILDLVYESPSGRLTAFGDDPSTVQDPNDRKEYSLQISISVRYTKLNTCQQVLVQPGIGTVSLAVCS